MSFPTDIQRDNPGCGEWAFLHAYRGSIAHGTYRPNSHANSIDDKDTMAFCVPPADTYLGLSEFQSRGTQEIMRDPWDIVIYESRKAIRLLAQGNPNVLAMLWLPDNLYIKKTDSGEYLLANKNAFVGRHVFKPFVGYATAQLRKMESGEYKGYMGDKRRELVEKFGYDTKNASHLIRLLRQGIEFLRDGELNVLRHDSAELLDIKDGKWGLDKVKEEANRLFRRAEDAYDRSTLPVRPDEGAVNDIAIEIARNELTKRGEL